MVGGKEPFNLRWRVSSSVMSKLRLKETPLEREERIEKEKRRATKKQTKRGPDIHFDYEHEPEERRWRLSEPTIYRTPADSGTSYDPGKPHATSQAKPSDRSATYDQIQRELEEAKFRAKLFDAMEDDERLDSMEARFNAYHVPERWQNTGTKTSTDNPDEMDEDQYAEWIRRGMWERRHKQEIEEEQRREKEREERRARERRQRRKQRELEEEARKSLKEKEAKVAGQAFDSYLSAWAALLASTVTQLRFRDIPWPLHIKPRSAEDVTPNAVTSFLLSESHSSGRSRKQRIRDTLLIYHPDRFEKWVLMIKDEKEKERAREVAGELVRILNSLGEE